MRQAGTVHKVKIIRGSVGKGKTSENERAGLISTSSFLAQGGARGRGSNRRGGGWMTREVQAVELADGPYRSVSEMGTVTLVGV